MSATVGLALVGCGYVADYYMATLRHYARLRLHGVYDSDPQRLAGFCGHYGLHAYDSLDALLSDERVDIVVNLTNPRAHYQISLAALEAGRHVYSEKPLAMQFSEACALVDLAAKRGLQLACAPCSVLGRAARTLSYAVEQRLCGQPLLVYAELDDGLVHRMAFKKWTSATGAPWPYRDEFETGCTLEHAGYYLGWLLEMFGNVVSVTAFSDCLVSDKLPDEPPLDPSDTADLSVGVLKFENGVVARLTTSIVAPHDHSIRVVGDEGLLYLNECWDNEEQVRLRRLHRIRRRTFLSPIARRIKLPGRQAGHNTDFGNTRMDFVLGIDALASALEGDTSLFTDAKFALHVTEVSLALQNAGTDAATYRTQSRF